MYYWLVWAKMNGEWEYMGSYSFDNPVGDRVKLAIALAGYDYQYALASTHPFNNGNQ